MNNLEGWGEDRILIHGMSSKLHYQKKFWNMRGIWREPVFPGYSGMVPHDAKETWFERNWTRIVERIPSPCILQPTDGRFKEIAALYYKEQGSSANQLLFHGSLSTKPKALRE